MSTGPWSAVASGVSSGLTLVIKIFEYTYALRAVDKQTEGYLITAQHAWENIKRCRDLLDDLRDTLSISEVKDYERVIEDTKKAAREVLILLEPARVDVETDCKIHLWTRVMWVLNDNSNIAAALRRLDIVHTTLTQNISTLRLMSELARPRDKLPTYEASQLIKWKHQTRGLTPKPSIQSLQTTQTAPLFAQSSVTLTPELEDDIPTLQEESPILLESRPLVPSISAPAMLKPDAIDSTEINETDVQRTVSQDSGSRPRSWIEYQAMKSSRMRNGQSGTGNWRNSR